MRVKAFVAIVVLVALSGLAACTPAPDPVTAPGPGESTPAPAPSPSHSTLAPTPTPDRDDPASWVLSNEGMGPLVLGVPFDDAVTAVPGLEDACGHAFSRRFGDPPEAVWIADADGVLGSVESSVVEGPRTADGIGVGSTTADVLAAHPGATVDGRNLAYLRAGNMFFGYQSDVMYDSDGAQYIADDAPEEIVSVGVTSGDVPWEYCG